MLKLKCSFKRLRQLGLQIWCLTKVRTRPGGRIGDFGKFFIVLTKSPLLLPYISQRSRFFRPNSPGIMENSLHETFYNVVNSKIFAQRKRVLRSSWILNERNLSCKIVKNCRIIGLNRARKNKFCVRGLYDQKLAHRQSTVSLRSYIQKH